MEYLTCFYTLHARMLVRVKHVFRTRFIDYLFNTEQDHNFAHVFGVCAMKGLVAYRAYSLVSIGR